MTAHVLGTTAHTESINNNAAAAEEAVPPPPLPPQQRRPRVREVSSRFMSPSVSSTSSSCSSYSSSSSGDHLNPNPPSTTTTSKSPPHKHHHSSLAHSPSPSASVDFQIKQRSKSVLRRRAEHDSPFCTSSAEGEYHSRSPETTRSLDTPLASHNSKINMLLPCVQRKQQRKLVFKENTGESRGAKLADHQIISAADNGLQSDKNFVAIKSSGFWKSGHFNTPARPDTPLMVSGGAADRMVPSRYRLTTSQSQHIHRSTSISIEGTISAAAKLLQSSGMTPMPAHSSNLDGVKVSKSCDNIDSRKAFAQKNNVDCCNAETKKTSCLGSPVSIQHNRTKSVSEVRSSMPEADMMPTVSTRLISDKFSNASHSNSSSKFPASPSVCSLNLSLPSCEPHSSVLNSVRPTGKMGSAALSKSSENLMKMESLSLPPQPIGMKLGADAWRGRKVSNHQEDVNSLKLLHNYYLQWRYANAKAEASLQTQKNNAERKLYSLGVKITDLCDAVQRKRDELQLLQRTKVLYAILEAQMPYLNEWSVFEEEYSTSLSGATNALINSATQLPVSKNIWVDVREVGEALDSALKFMETIGTHVQGFMTKAEETDVKLSELARVTRGERSLIEECGDMLLKTYTSQVEECSLRGHLIQLHRGKVC